MSQPLSAALEGDAACPAAEPATQQQLQRARLLQSSARAAQTSERLAESRRQLAEAEVCFD
jgi:hypothetical protein